MMKCTDDYLTFIKKIAHITSRFGMACKFINFEFCFKDHIGMHYESYKKRACKQNKEFDLSETDFNLIKSLPCYICGKHTGDLHVNGIDKLDNTCGYFVGNVLSCCTDCNKLKKDWSFCSLLTKIYNIFVHWTKSKKIFNDDSLFILSKENIKLMLLQTNLFLENKNRILHTNITSPRSKIERLRSIKKYGDVGYKKILALRKQHTRIKDKVKQAEIKAEIELIKSGDVDVKSHKKVTAKQKREQGKLRQQKRRAEQRKKYGDEEYKKKHSEEIALVRQKRKLIDQ